MGSLSNGFSGGVRALGAGDGFYTGLGAGGGSGHLGSGAVTCGVFVGILVAVASGQSAFVRISLENRK